MAGSSTRASPDPTGASVRVYGGCGYCCRLRRFVCLVVPRELDFGIFEDTSGMILDGKVLAKRFGLRQGEKLRVIDDCSIAGLNFSVGLSTFGPFGEIPIAHDGPVSSHGFTQFKQM